MNNFGDRLIVISMCTMALSAASMVYTDYKRVQSINPVIVQCPDNTKQFVIPDATKLNV